MIKHIELGKEEKDGPLKDHQFIKVYIEKGVDLDRLQDSIVKSVTMLGQLALLKRKASS